MPVSEKSLANLRPYRKGQSGNPGGRPRNTLSAAYKRQLEKLFPGDPEGRSYAEVIAAAVADKAALGDYQAAKEIEDRVSGKPKQTISVGSELVEYLERQVDVMMEAAESRGDVTITRNDCLLALSASIPEAIELMN